jgi:eukaryotic-like serine/threonine-protein kinase
MTRYADRYQVLHRIGSGGMATVFLAQDERLGRQVAIKRLRAESSEDAAARFRREAQLAASLNHPNVVTVYDILSDEDAVLIVMEYVAGSDLGRRLKKSDPIPRERSLQILRDAAAGLDHAHGHGVVHRDVKPSNVLLGERGEAKLTDLGVAKVLEDTSATRAGAMPGTPLYMAPEQLRGERVTPATDIYSLALIAFQMLSGKHPRRGGTIAEIAHQVVNDPVPDLREAWPEAPVEAAAVLRRALDRNPAVRPRSAPELVRQLESALGGHAEMVTTATATMPLDPTQPPCPPPVPGRPLAVPPPRHRSHARALAAIAVLAVAVLLGVLLLSDGGDGEIGEGGERRAENAGQRQAGGGAPAPGEPAAAVRAFYERAAAGDFAAAWQLASPGLRGMFGDYGSFAAEFATLESIRFTSLETISETTESAQVAFSTVATHTDFTDICSGTAALLHDGQAWLLDNPGVSCERSS